MTDFSDTRTMIGRTAVDSDGDKIGKIGQVYVDDRTNEPQWVTISTGLFGTKAQVKDAPNLDADGHLDDDDNEALYSYYGSADRGHDTATQPVAAQQDTGVQTGEHDTSGPDTDERTVTEQVRKEQIDTDVDGRPAR